MKFTYRSGQRPLDGYTLKRGVGRGGFGEVYFAVSDGGKEVALKLLGSGAGDAAVELRGAAQCLNLKHPNLVSLYDLKTDPEGRFWVVMEYVAGEPLSAVLARHPQGLAPDLAREWFLGLARAVAHLHDQGVVHRDLKPGNVFIENGQVKVGDYGLSKALSCSQRQTQSVGTVYYMAPEISTGNYGKPIDVYAAGIILYEMLTGKVPFPGDSAAEVLMKHLTSSPDLSRVPPEYVPVLARALSKDPAQRFPSMVELARAVEAAGRPKEAPTPGPSQAEPRPRPSGADPLTALPAFSNRALLSELCGSLALTVLFAALAVPLWCTLTGSRDTASIGSFFFLTVGCSWAVLVPARWWTERRGDTWARRTGLLALGALVGVAALWLDGWSPGLKGSGLGTPAHGGFVGAVASKDAEAGWPRTAPVVAYYAFALFALRWWRLADRRRPMRFSVAPLLAAAFWGLVLWPVLGVRGMVGPGALVTTAAVVQLVSPWQKATPVAVRRLRLRQA
jgi:hypothetical protein